MAKSSDTNTAATENNSPAPAETTGPTVHWDDSKMVTHFANVVNIQSTLDQVDLFFGTNQTWAIGSDQQVKVELTDRVILSPHAAKRLSVALDGVLKEYESRYGTLRINGR